MTAVSLITRLERREESCPGLRRCVLEVLDNYKTLRPQSGERDIVAEVLERARYNVRGCAGM